MVQRPAPIYRKPGNRPGNHKLNNFGTRTGKTKVEVFKKEDGELVPMNIKKGDKVMFFKYAGDKMYDDKGVEYIVVRENDILATM